MRGTTGKYVAFYREVQDWVTSQTKKTGTPTAKAVELKHQTGE
jgi:hypothetical protein